MKKRKLTPEEIAYSEARLEQLRALERRIAAEIEAREQRRSPARRRRLWFR